eukprot:Em0011g407a
MDLLVNPELAEQEGEDGVDVRALLGRIAALERTVAGRTQPPEARQQGQTGAQIGPSLGTLPPPDQLGNVRLVGREGALGGAVPQDRTTGLGSAQLQPNTELGSRHTSNKQRGRGAPASTKRLQPAHRHSGLMGELNEYALMQHSGVCVGDGLPPVPAKLAERIWNWEFIDMVDLLPDQWLVKKEEPAMHFGAAAAHVGIPSRRGKKQEYSGTAWAQYDATYRRQAASSGDRSWSKINPSLFSICFTGKAVTNNSRCDLCLSAYHPTGECPSALDDLDSVCSLRLVRSVVAALDNAKPQPGVALTFDPAGMYQYTRDLLALDQCRAKKPWEPPASLGAIESPFRWERWAARLADHSDKKFSSYILEGISSGFRIGFNYSEHSGHRGRGNMVSIRNSSVTVTQYLQEERLGRVIGTRTPRSGSFMSKVDIRSAYRTVPVHPEDRWLLGMEWDGQLFVDTVLPFGLRSAPKIFSVVADAAEWIARAGGVRILYHYLDDVVLLSKAEEAAEQLNLFLGLLLDLGMPVAPEKLEGPGPVVTFLGIEIDTLTMELRLPEKKLVELGKLQHACKVVRPGRTFLRRVFALLSGAREGYHHIRLNQEFQSDIAWWDAFLEGWNGTSMLADGPDEELVTVDVYTDASGSFGCGAFWKHNWLQFRWPGEWGGRNITLKEILPVVLACAIWGQEWKGSFTHTSSTARGTPSAASRQPAGLDVQSLVPAIHELFSVGIALSMAKAYRSGRNRYENFCLGKAVPRWAVGQYGKVVYLAAVRHAQIEMGFGDPHISDMPKLEYVVKGMQKRSALAAGRPRLPITPVVLRALKRSWEAEADRASAAMLWAAACLCFFGFLRSGEVVVPSESVFDPQSHLCFEDVATDSRHAPSFIQVTLKTSKTDPFRKGVTLTIGSTGADVCPVAAVLNYMAKRGSAPGPLFKYSNGRYLTRDRFVSDVRAALTKAGMKARLYSGHSFRIGAATTASLCGMQDSLMGAFTNYVTQQGGEGIRSIVTKCDLTTDAHPTKPKQLSQAEVAKRWNEMKKEADYHTKVNALISDLKAIAMTKKGRLLAFWGNQAVPNHTTEGDSDHSLTIEAPSETTNSLSSVVSTNPNELCTSGSSSRYKSTAQTDLQHQIDLINGDLVGLCRRQSSNMLTKEQETELHCKKRKKEELEKLLKKKRNDQKRAQKYRAKRKHVMLDLCEKNPEVKELLKLREKSGRPRLEEDQPLLLQAIVDIALHGAPAHERRQCEVYRSIKTLDELTAQLKKDGFQISRSGTYLRLIPRRGLTAATMQSPLLMHVEYRVTLPDHDWVVAGRHKLIPSVIAGIKIEENSLGMQDAVGYSGPTYIAIRSGKHCSSTAYAHGLDFKDCWK